MGRYRILVVEDDDAVRDSLVATLQVGGFDTSEEDSGKTAIKTAVNMEYDLLLLDLELPGPNGMQILAAIRETRPTLPVIILTGKGDGASRVAGLDGGADDYIVKPFSGPELIARIRAVLRRSPERPIDVRYIDIPNGRADLDQREVVFQDGTREELSEREETLLRYLATNAGRTVTREEILSRVYRINPRAVVGTRTVDMLVTRLRKRLRDEGDPPVVATVRGRGYRLGKPEASDEDEE